ncbi:MAG: hypothetical protein KGH75_01370 [Rhodospirillales bacterium]|nr:hypothetical protein [Rhodospirillales bacterium]
MSNTPPTIYTAGTAGSIAVSISVIAEWLFSLAHVTIPANVETAFGILVTTVLHYVICRTKTTSSPAASAPAN